MKKIISLAIVCCLFATSTLAQSKTAYFMDGYNYRHELNPAASPYRGYINLMGHYAIGVNSNLSATQFLYPNADGSALYTFLHPEVSASDFLNKLHDNNILGLNTDIDIFGFGFNARRGYFSFDTKLHVGLSSNLPKELFAFLKQGMSSDHTVYDIRNFNVSASAYASAGIGYAYDLFDNLRIGVKAKYLVGLAAANANIDQMRVDMSSDAWTVNTQATMSAYGHGLRPVTGTTDENGNEVPTDYITGLEFPAVETLAPAGKGFAFDFGLCYSPIKKLNISAALTNVGNIRWDSESVINAQSTGEVSFSGLTLDLEASGEDAIAQLGEDISNNLINMIQFKQIAQQGAAVQKLDSRLLLAADYKPFRGLNAGLIYTLDNTAYGQFDELTATANISLLKDLQFAGSYTLLSDYGRSYGFALNFCSLIYLSWDHILTHFSPQFVPLDVLSTQFEVGLRLPIGKYKKRDLPKLLYFGK